MNWTKGMIFSRAGKQWVIIGMWYLYGHKTHYEIRELYMENGTVYKIAADKIEAMSTKEFQGFHKRLYI